MQSSANSRIEDDSPLAFHVLPTSAWIARQVQPLNFADLETISCFGIHAFIAKHVLCDFSIIRRMVFMHDSLEIMP